MNQGQASRSPERKSHFCSSSFKMNQRKDENRQAPQFRIYEGCHLFFPNIGKMGAWSTCLLFPSSSCGCFGEDALLRGERSMAALTEVFSCGLKRIRHSSRAVIYLSYLRHCPQSHKCEKADSFSLGKAKADESIIKNCLNSWHLCLSEKLQKGRGNEEKVLLFFFLFKNFLWIIFY